MLELYTETTAFNMFIINIDKPMNWKESNQLKSM